MLWSPESCEVKVNLPSGKPRVLTSASFVSTNCRDVSTIVKPAKTRLDVHLDAQAIVDDVLALLVRPLLGLVRLPEISPRAERPERTPTTIVCAGSSSRKHRGDPAGRTKYSA